MRCARFADMLALRVRRERGSSITSQARMVDPFCGLEALSLTHSGLVYLFEGLVLQLRRKETGSVLNCQQRLSLLLSSLTVLEAALWSVTL